MLLATVLSVSVTLAAGEQLEAARHGVLDPPRLGQRDLASHDIVRQVAEQPQLGECIDQVEQPGDLDVFANFFEAFMGYYKQYE